MSANKGRTILITGVTRGLGRELVARFAENAHTVIGCGRNGVAIDELRGRHPGPHRFDVVDVAVDQQVAAWSQEILGLFPAPDLLINNAAIMNELAPMWDVPQEEFDSVIDVNIKGVMNVVRHFAPAMIAERRGVIVNISSGWGRSTAPEVGPYCTTKWAIEGLARSLADDLPAGLASVAVNPGVIDTEMLQTCFGAAASSYENAEEWSRRAAPFLLALGAKDNGRALEV